MRTVALYQTGSDKDGSTVYYEFGRAVLDGPRVQLTAFQQADLQEWIRRGVPVKKGYVLAREGDAFLTALREDYSKGGRTFALDSDRESVPPSLFQITGAKKYEETVAVKTPRGASARQENALHRAADSHLDDLTTLMTAAFDKGRGVIRKNHQNVAGAVDAMKKYLYDTLPDALLAILADGGAVTMDQLIQMRIAGGTGSGNFGHGGGEVGGSTVVFHGTIKDNLDSIKQEGLTASHSGAIWHYFSKPGYVYAASDRTTAEEWAKLAAEHATIPAPNSERQPGEAAVPVVLEVAIPKSEATRLAPDSNFIDSVLLNNKFEFKGDIKPEWIRQGWMLSGSKRDSDGNWVGEQWIKALAETANNEDVIIVYIPFALIDHEPKTAASKRTFDSGSEAAVDWADRHAAELIDTISENSREDISNAIASALEDGSLDDALDEILAAVGDKTRAELIARTEIMRAVNAGQREAWDQAVEEGLLSGDEQRSWIATDDELTCPICGALDGETIGLDAQYSDGSDGPPAHPRCLPGDCLVLSGSQIAGASKRIFEGDMVVVRVSEGRELTCTPNHPILTPSGWVAAGALNVGSRVICDARREWISAINGNHQEVPTRIQDVTDSILKSSGVSRTAIPVSSEDFHGDGGGSKVAIIGANRLQRDHSNLSFVKQVAQFQFVGTSYLSQFFHARGVIAQFFKAIVLVTRRSVSSFSLRRPFIVRHAGPFHEFSLGLIPDHNVSLTQSPLDERTASVELARQLIDGRACEIFTDEVVYVNRFPFRGHVYNLDTLGGWYAANGILTQNCRCTEGIVGVA